MVIRFYFDEHIARTVAEGLSERGYDVTMAIDVGMEGKDDDTEHLLFAAEHDLVLVTFDRPFAGRTMLRTDHSGLICLSEHIRTNIGPIIHLLSEFADQYTLEETRGRVFWLK